MRGDEIATAANVNQWTGGQYSIVRVIFGMTLTFQALWLLTQVKSSFAVTLLVSVTSLAVLLTIGLYDRVAAFILSWVCLVIFGAAHTELSALSVSGLWVALFLHLFMPSAPYGSWGRRGRPDPGCDWRMPQELYVFVWILLVLLCLWFGVSNFLLILEHRVWHSSSSGESAAVVLDFSFVLLVWFRRLRPWLWLVMLIAQPLISLLLRPGEIGSAGMSLLLLAFDPGWISAMKAEATEMVFYDGHCGLCHRAVRFILAEDRASVFRFAPLDSEAFRAAVPEKNRAGLPDSVIIQKADGELLTRSSAVLHLMKRLGGVWRIMAVTGAIIPAALRDRAYDWIAGVRHRLFTAPVEACPIIPKHLRARFEM